MTLTVLQVAYPFAPVGPDAVGGAEQVLSSLDHALSKLGHRSIVVACEGSVAQGEQITVPRCCGTITDETRAAIHAEYREGLERTLRRHQVDVVHMHGFDFHTYLPPPGVPTLATLHLPPSWYPQEVFSIQRPHTWLNPVSRWQHRSCPPCASLLEPVENGVPVDKLRVGVSKRDYAIALGRICPEKNLHQALDAGTRAGVPVLLCGEVFPYEEHERYFREEIAPRLRKGPHRFLGPVGSDRKRRLLSGARCLVSASLAETSSLVAMEALACGTPVVALRSGALPEIVDNGRTGFIVDGLPEMVEAIRNTPFIRPETCQAAARRHFSVEAMVSRYLNVYERVLRAQAGDAAFA